MYEQTVLSETTLHKLGAHLSLCAHTFCLAISQHHNFLVVPYFLGASSGLQ